MAGKGSQSSKRGSSTDASDSKRNASSRDVSKPAQNAGPQRSTHDGSSGQKNGSTVDR